MKHLILILVVITAMAGWLSACEPSPESTVIERTKEVILEVEEVATVPVEVKVELPPSEGEVVTFFAWAAGPFERAAIERMVDRFNEENPDISVELTFGGR